MTAEQRVLDAVDRVHPIDRAGAMQRRRSEHGTGRRDSVMRLSWRPAGLWTVWS